MKTGHKMISHGGGINGFASLLSYFPESDRTIAILANTEGFNTAALMDRIIDVMDESATNADKKRGGR